MKTNPGNLSSIEKALKILLAFAPFNNEMGTLELSEKLAIHKSTVSRLLHVLTSHEFLHQNPDTKKYLLGRSAAKIGNAVIKSLNNNIVTIALPYLNDLCDQVGESVALEILSGTNVFLAHHVEGQTHIRFNFKPGEQVPLHVAAGAKAILAFSDPGFVGSCFKKKLTRYTPNTITTKKKFLAELEEVKKAGVAYDRGERFEEAHAMAAPIFNHERLPVAAVVMAGPAFRLTPSFLARLVAPLKKTAAAISQRLFY